MEGEFTPLFLFGELIVSDLRLFLLYGMESEVQSVALDSHFDGLEELACPFVRFF